MKKIIVAALLLPLAAFAQGPGPGPGPGQGRMRWRDDPKAAEKMERRMHLARTLGLAEALDLEPKKALELGDVIAKHDERRAKARAQMRDAHDVLRKAASGEKVSAQEVDQAIQRGMEARSQLAQIDKEILQAVVKDLSPEQKARAVLFLDRFQRRFAFGRGGDMGDQIRRVIRQRAGPGGMGPGMGMGPGDDDGRAMAFSFGGNGKQKRIITMGPAGGLAFIGEDDDTLLFEPDDAFDDQFDIEVHVENGE
jgi:hypothetical protein